MSLKSPIDPEIFAELLSLQEATHPTLVQELVDLFISTSVESLQKMDLILKKGDMKALAEVAHGMKSSAANLGASELSKLCFALENQEGLPAPTPAIHELVKSIRSEFVLAERALQQQLKTAAA